MRWNNRGFSNSSVTHCAAVRHLSAKNCSGWENRVCERGVIAPFVLVLDGWDIPIRDHDESVSLCVCVFGVVLCDVRPA